MKEEDQSIAIAVIQTQIENLGKSMDRNFNEIKVSLDNQKVSYNGKFKMVDDRVTEETKERILCYKDHEDRLKTVEVRQAVVTTKLAMIISGIVFFGVFAVEKIYDFIKDLFK